MVSFSCDGCGEILKKSQVDTHANRCRNCFAVSCVDCNVSFPGDDYRKHTSCMTEAEKYQKTDYKGISSNSNNNKKQIKLTPQQSWNNILELSINTAPKHLQECIQTISSYDNVPRKEKQFINFIKNSLRGCNPTTIKHIWDHLQLTRTVQQAQQTRPEILKGSVDHSTTSATTTTPTKINVDDDNDEQDNGTNNAKIESQSVPPTGTDGDDDDEEEDTNVIESSVDKPSKGDKNSVTKSSSKVTNKNLPKSKVVIKVMKSILKNAKNNKLSTKELRKTVARQLQQQQPQQYQFDKNQIRQLIREVIQSDNESSKKRFTIQGKIIALRTY